MKERIMKEIWTNYEGDIKGTWRKYENNWKYMFLKKKEKHVIFSIPVEFCKWESSGAWRTQGSWLHSLHLARFAGVHWRTPSMSETSWSLSSMAKLQDPGPRTRGTKNARRNRLDTDFRMWVKWIKCESKMKWRHLQTTIIPLCFPSQMPFWSHNTCQSYLQ